MTSSGSQRRDRPAVSRPGPVWPLCLLIWLVTGALVIGPFLEVQGTIGGGTTGPLPDDWGSIFSTLRDLGWLLFDVVVVVPLALFLTVMLASSRRKKMRAAQVADTEAAAKAKRARKGKQGKKADGNGTGK